MTADPQKRATYRAEERLHRWLETAGPTVTVDATAYTPEIEERFSSPADIQRYVDAVLGHLGDVRAVTVRARRGNTKAVYADGVIAIPPLAVGGSWALRGSVVLHELAHHLTAGDGHGAEFRATFIRLLEDIGKPVWAELLHLAYASEGLGAVEHHVTDDTIARIAKILRQAERASNEHERSAFLAKAQSLATRHSVALAVARAHSAADERRHRPVEETVVIGPQGKRGLTRYVRLLLTIAAVNDLRCLISHDSTRVFLHGFSADIEVAKALYESVLVQMVADCETYLRESGPEPGAATISRRLAFYEGYALRIGQRLQRARRKVQRQAVSLAEASESTALALRAKELEVSDHFAEVLRRQNVRGSWRGGRLTSAPSSVSSFSAGHAAADRARLGGEKALGSAMMGP